MSDSSQLATALKAARADLKNHVYMQIAKMLGRDRPPKLKPVRDWLVSRERPKRSYTWPVIET